MPVVRFKVEIEEVGIGSYDSPTLVSVAFDETGFCRYELATGTTDQAIPISTSTGVATIQALFILSDQTITFRQAAADTGESITANRPFLITGTSMTAALLSNASGSTANVRVFVAGT